MNEEETYFFHQTPPEAAKDLLAKIAFDPTDTLYEPFRGEGSFYDNFPEANPKDWSEIKQGRDYKDYTGSYDWVISNPPFRLETDSGRVNSFYYLLHYYAQRAKKGIAFLGNDHCLGALTPKRMKVIHDLGFSITQIVVCNIKKWRGRYFFVILEKNKQGIIDYLDKSY
jgi:hypothetical protein